MAIKEVNKELMEIEQFVKWCKRDDHVDGFNIYSSKHLGRCYVLAKSDFDPKPKYALKVEMDYCNPVERPLIINALNRGIFGMDLEPEQLDKEMVGKVEDYDYAKGIANQKMFN